MTTPDDEFAALVAEVRACRLCAAVLPLGPRPVLRVSPTARVLIVGQAPGTAVHASGVPWDDRSGDRLRMWLSLDRDRFYDETSIAIMPIGLCYPGRLAGGGDRPPRPECAPLWHPRLRPALAAVRLTVLIGRYAQAFYLGALCGRTTTDTIRAGADVAPDFLPLPHPSWRTLAWERDNPWFTAEVLPEARRRVGEALSGRGG